MTWQEKTLAKMRDLIPKEISLNTRIVDTLHVSYLSAMRSGHVPPLFINKTIDNNGVLLVNYFKKSVNADPLTSKAFLYALYSLSKSGEIPFSKYDPSGVEKDTTIAKSYSQNNSWIDKTGSILKSASNRILLIGAVALTGYFLISKKR